jgi:hypothetical protein
VRVHYGQGCRCANWGVTLKFLTRHPEKRHMTAVSLVAAAFEEAFPWPTATAARR